MWPRLVRWWHIKLLQWRGWPDPVGTVEWLEQRKIDELIETQVYPPRGERP